MGGMNTKHALILLILTLAACGGNPAPTNPTAGPLSTVAPVSFSRYGGPITRANANKITLIGTLTGHKGTVNQLAFARAKNWLVSIDALSVAYLWDLTTGAQVATLSSSNPQLSTDGDVTFAAFSPDDSSIVLATNRNLIRFVETATRRILSELAIPGGIASVAISPDRRVLATGGNAGALGLWDVATGQALRIDEKAAVGAIRAVAFSANGALVAAVISSAEGPIVRMWEVATGRAVADLTGFVSLPRRIVFSPDGRYVAVGGGKEAHVFSVGGTYTRRFRLTNDTLNAGAGMAFSPDGRLFAALGTGDIVFTWTAAEGQVVGGLPDHKRAATGLTFSPNGELLVTLIAAPNTGAYLWPVASLLPGAVSFPRGTIGVTTNGFLMGEWSSDGRLLVLAEATGALLVWGIPPE